MQLSNKKILENIVQVQLGFLIEARALIRSVTLRVTKVGKPILAIDPIINIDASKSTDPDIERLLPEDRLDIEGTLCYNAMILNYTWTCNVYKNGVGEPILTSNCQAAINRASEGTYSNETSCQDPMGNQAMRLCCHQSILQVRVSHA